jgi:hypothetical protein
VSTFTPRGLKIRLEAAWAFALMARLYPKVNAWKVLRTTEALEQLPAACSLVFGGVSIANGFSIYEISAYILLGSVIGSFLALSSLVRLPGVIPFANLCNVFPFFTVPWTILIIYGLYEYNWGLGGVLIIIFSKLLAFAIDLAIGFLRTRYVHSTSGEIVHSSETNFFHAYQYYAEQIGVTTSIEVSDEEMMEENWIACFKDLAHNHPGKYLQMSE